jgi:AraC-like DNA-binding protein
MTVDLKPHAERARQSVNAIFTPSRIYISAWLLALTGILSSAFSHKIHFGILYVALGLFSIGYLIRISDLLRNKWGSALRTVRKIGFNILFNGVVYLTSTLFARIAVSGALQLPVKDFEVTVQIVSIVFFPAVWILFALILFLLATAISVLHLFFHISKLSIFSFGDTFFSLFLLKPRDWRTNEKNSIKKSMVLFSDMAGVIVITYLLAFAFDKYRAAIEYRGETIKQIAYAFDYQSAARYPNIDHTRRVCFHDNGVISYASLDHLGHVVIDVRNNADK